MRHAQSSEGAARTRGRDDERGAVAVQGAEPLARVVEAVSAQFNRVRLGARPIVLDGELQGLFRVRPRIRGNPLVTILMPTDDRTRDIDGRLLALVPNAVRSIVQKTSYKNFELLIVDNGRMSDETKSFLSEVPHRRISYTIEGSFNFAHKLNFCARHAEHRFWR